MQNDMVNCLLIVCLWSIYTVVLLVKQRGTLARHKAAHQRQVGYQVFTIAEAEWLCEHRTLLLLGNSF